PRAGLPPDPAMAWKYPLLQHIAEGRDPALTRHPATARALAAAWATAHPAGRRQLVAALLRHGPPENRLTLITHLDELDPPTRAELAQNLHLLHTPLRLALGRAEPGPQRHALALIRDAHAGGLAYLVVEKLRHPDPALRRDAGQTLLHLADAGPHLTAPDRLRLVQAVNQALLRYAHHQHPATLDAWLTLAPYVPTLDPEPLGALEDPDHPAVAPLRDRLKLDPSPKPDTDAPEKDTPDRVIRGLVPALLLATLAPAAVAGLRQLALRGRLAPALLGQEHLLDLPAVRRRLAHAGQPDDLALPQPSAPATAMAPSTAPRDLSETAPESVAASTPAPAWAAWLDALPLSPAAKLRRLADLLRSPESSPTARLDALRRLTALAPRPTPSPIAPPADSPDLTRQIIDALRPLGDDPDSAVARLAAAWCLAPPRPDRDTLDTLRRSRHAAVRRLAERRLAATAFDRLWHAWPKLNDAARLAAARAALRVDPSTRPRLDAQLRRGGPGRRRAVEITTYTDAVPPAPPAITAAAGQPALTPGGWP
ncbi:MAG: hypothetical protein AAGG38_15115, partial [Planctomycetota bacterium]